MYIQVIVLLQAWLNEKFAPELLEAKTDLVECMLGQITAMEENIKQAKRGDFKVSIHRMEVSRLLLQLFLANLRFLQSKQMFQAKTKAYVWYIMPHTPTHTLQKK